MVLRIGLGVVSILFGILVLVWPGISLAILVIMVGIWAIIIGGALSILFGILVLIWPGTGVVSIIWIIGIWAIVWGITLIVLGVQLRKAASTTEAGASPTA